MMSLETSQHHHILIKPYQVSWVDNRVMRKVPFARDWGTCFLFSKFFDVSLFHVHVNSFVVICSQLRITTKSLLKKFKPPSCSGKVARKINIFIAPNQGNFVMTIHLSCTFIQEFHDSSIFEPSVRCRCCIGNQNSLFPTTFLWFH